MKTAAVKEREKKKKKEDYFQRLKTMCEEMGRTSQVSENVWLFLILKFTPIECDVELHGDVELLGTP